MGFLRGGSTGCSVGVVQSSGWRRRTLFFPGGTTSGVSIRDLETTEATEATEALKWNAISASKSDRESTNLTCSHGRLVEASPGVGKKERKKESEGGRGGEKILLYCERKLIYLVESDGDGEWEAGDLVPRRYRLSTRDEFNSQ